MNIWMPIMGTKFAVMSYVMDEEQAKINHGQTLEVLASRGGVDPYEAICLIEKKKLDLSAILDGKMRKITIDDLVKVLEKK